MLLLTLHSVCPVLVNFLASQWLQQCLQLLPDGLHLRYHKDDFQVFVAAMQIPLRLVCPL